MMKEATKNPANKMNSIAFLTNYISPQFPTNEINLNKDKRARTPTPLVYSDELKASMYLEENSVLDPRKTIKDLSCAIRQQKGGYLKEELAPSDFITDLSVENIEQSCLLETGVQLGRHQKPNEHNDILAKFMTNKKKNLDNPEFILGTEENFIFQDGESCYLLDDIIDVKDIADKNRLNRENLEQLRSIFAEDEAKTTVHTDIPNQGRFPIHKIIKKNSSNKEESATKEEAFYKYRAPHRSSSLTQRKDSDKDDLRGEFDILSRGTKIMTDRLEVSHQNRAELEVAQGILVKESNGQVPPPAKEQKVPLGIPYQTKNGLERNRETRSASCSKRRIFEQLENPAILPFSIADNSECTNVSTSFMNQTLSKQNQMERKGEKEDPSRCHSNKQEGSRGAFLNNKETHPFVDPRTIQVNYMNAIYFDNPHVNWNYKGEKSDINTSNIGLRQEINCFSVIKHTSIPALNNVQSKETLSNFVQSGKKSETRLGNSGFKEKKSQITYDPKSFIRESSDRNNFSKIYFVSKEDSIDKSRRTDASADPIGASSDEMESSVKGVTPFHTANHCDSNSFNIHDKRDSRISITKEQLNKILSHFNKSGDNREMFQPRLSDNLENSNTTCVNESQADPPALHLSEVIRPNLVTRPIDSTVPFIESARVLPHRPAGTMQKDHNVSEIFLRNSVVDGIERFSDLSALSNVGLVQGRGNFLDETDRSLLDEFGRISQQNRKLQSSTTSFKDPLHDNIKKFLGDTSNLTLLANNQNQTLLTEIEDVIFKKGYSLLLKPSDEASFKEITGSKSLFQEEGNIDLNPDAQQRARENIQTECYATFKPSGDSDDCVAPPTARIDGNMRVSAKSLQTCLIESRDLDLTNSRQRDSYFRFSVIDEIPKKQNEDENWCKKNKDLDYIDQGINSLVENYKKWQKNLKTDEENNKSQYQKFRPDSLDSTPLRTQPPVPHRVSIDLKTVFKGDEEIPSTRSTLQNEPEKTLRAFKISTASDVERMSIHLSKKENGREALYKQVPPRFSSLEKERGKEKYFMKRQVLEKKITPEKPCKPSTTAREAKKQFKDTSSPNHGIQCSEIVSVTVTPGKKKFNLKLRSPE